MEQRQQQEPGQTTPDADLRVSDIERGRVVEVLSAHAGQGRLTLEELDARVEGAHAARTRGELAVLTADLPREEGAEQRGPSSGRAARRPWPDLPGQVGAFLAVNVMLVAIWALSGGGYFWPLWPILGWGLGLVRPGACRRRRAAASTPVSPHRLIRSPAGGTARPFP